jgi:hypothetical protein
MLVSPTSSAGQSWTVFGVQQTLFGKRELLTVEEFVRWRDVEEKAKPQIYLK